jgi:hypothetical protein
MACAGRDRHLVPYSRPYTSAFELDFDLSFDQCDELVDVVPEIAPDLTGRVDPVLETVTALRPLRSNLR